MLEDKTYKVKVGDHHDAVIFVYERHRKCLNPDDKPEDHRWKHWKEVVTVIPVFDDGDYQNSEGVLLNNVKVTVDALSELYSSCPDYEMGIEYTMNTHQYINV